MWQTKTLYLAAVLSVAAAMAHLWAMPEHFEEWWGYGVFFLAVALVQVLYGAALLRWPGRQLLMLGVGLNLAVLGLYIVTRTIGVPFFGPHAGEVEGVGILDLSAMVVEVALVIALAALLWSRQPDTAVDLARETGLARVDEPVPAVSRRDFLKAAGVAGALGVSGGALGLRTAGGVGALGIAGGALGVHAGQAHGQQDNATAPEGETGGEIDAAGHEGDVGGHGGKGDVDLSRFDPSDFLRDFYWGEERQEGGRTIREYEITAEDAEIEVAPGMFYPAWTFNGQVPGPTIRAREGDRMRVVFKNRGTHPHTMHFHGIHPANMDGSL